jgi:hypothetical protein
MEIHDTQRLSRSELEAFFDRLFPNGFAGLDVAGEIAPEGWEQSPLVACFHPSAERVFEEELRIHRNIESLFHVREHQGDGKTHVPLAEPTLEDVRLEHQLRLVRADEELAELVASCLWDVFSDNHDVMVADVRVADVGSFRGASAFLDEYLMQWTNPRQPRCAHIGRCTAGSAWVAACVSRCRQPRIEPAESSQTRREHRLVRGSAAARSVRGHRGLVSLNIPHVDDQT